jgi:hypothetical protein
MRNKLTNEEEEKIRLDFREKAKAIEIKINEETMEKFRVYSLKYNKQNP